MKLLDAMIMLIIGLAAAVLSEASQVFAQVGAPSFTQGIVDTLLGVIAMGIWKIVGVASKISQNVRDTKRRTDILDHQVGNLIPRVNFLDGKEVPPYNP